MDVFSYMEKAYKAMKLIKDTLDDLKDAPDNLQLLRLRASSIEELLNRLDQLPPRSSSDAADADLQCLAVIAAKRLEEVEVFLAKMRRTGKNGKIYGSIAIQRIRGSCYHITPARRYLLCAHRSHIHTHSPTSHLTLPEPSTLSARLCMSVPPS
ncbi:hypothetical protein BC835DRAFT_408451 [Cytidiella melzeri]|nr:hypothetical protein BC835DRAFT_408451 [Cytidiella melzeri]